MNKLRPRITEDEYKVVQQYRDELNKHKALIEECDAQGIPIEDVNYYWLKSQKFSINVKNKISISDTISGIIEQVKGYSPKYPTIKYTKLKDPHLLVIDPADIHINKLARTIETGDEYNHDIAFSRVKEAVLGLINRSQGYSIDTIVLIIGNDILHVDNSKNTTTAGTSQDVSMMWYDAFKIAQKLLIEVIEMLIQVAPTHVIYNPSNHDKVSGYYLAQVIEAWFSKSKSVTFDITPSHRKYYTYGSNLIGTCHGDGAKDNNLPLLMAHESIDWSKCRHRYFYTHHIHHKKSKDYMGVTVESMRSPSGADSYHHQNGFQHAPKGIDAFIHHPENGQVARLSYIF